MSPLVLFRCVSKSYVKYARSLLTSTSQTRTFAVGGNAELTAISHMAHLFSVGVSRLGLSGRGPQGVSQTSSTRRLLKICAQQRTWSTVGGSKAPPKTATRTFCGGVAAPLSAAMRRTAAAAMMAARERIAAKERIVIAAHTHECWMLALACLALAPEMLQARAGTH